MEKILINDNKYDKRININKIKVDIALRFLDFLKKNKVLDAFLNNFFLDSSLREGYHTVHGQEGFSRGIIFTMPHNMLNNIHFYLNNVNEMQYLNNAFVWSNTEEHHSFWSKLDNEWTDYVGDYWDSRIGQEEP